ncbi:hypothetical protein [Pseudoalteromonas sp. SR44-2]|uniref:hypothetical protein n=1 Tax=Pseudoalteromonas sp. SR44-2 TaxID=2760937 RepID=UPI001603F99A|nr:hypothetical protein [Pseudoalteromonas sp. SR44-2]MBB1338206.1 hypothetical protein [Pseudoalteromonas sp. SR44-2]
MFKFLDKFMDDLESPYWPIYGMILTFAFIFTVIVVLFFFHMYGKYKMLSSWANVSSIISTILTLCGLIYAIAAYKKSRSEHKVSISISWVLELENEVLPKLKYKIPYVTHLTAKMIAFIRGGGYPTDPTMLNDFEESKKDLTKLSNELFKRVLILRSLECVNKKHTEEFEEITKLLRCLIDFNENIKSIRESDSGRDSHNRRELFMEKVDESKIYLKYMRPRDFSYMDISIVTTGEGIEAAKQIDNEIECLIQNVQKYITLQTN